MLTKCINRNKIYIFAHTYMHHNSLCFMNIAQYSWLLDKATPFIHRVTPKNGMVDFQYFTIKKIKVACFGVIAYNIIFWKEWYQDHWTWVGRFDSMAFSWNMVICEFCSVWTSKGSENSILVMAGHTLAHSGPLIRANKTKMYSMYGPHIHKISLYMYMQHHLLIQLNSSKKPLHYCNFPWFLKWQSLFYAFSAYHFESIFLL